MELRKAILAKHMAAAAIEQIADDYTMQGYTVVEASANLSADLVVSKGSDVIAFEVKVGQWSDEKRRAVREMRNRVVHELRGRFQLVLVRVPEEPDILVEDLDFLLGQIVPEHLVDELNLLATHQQVEEVTDISFTTLIVGKDSIQAIGTATVTLILQIGSDSDQSNDDGLRWNEGYDLEFSLVLRKDLTLLEIDYLRLVTESEES